MKITLTKMLVCCLLTNVLLSSNTLPGVIGSVAAQETQEETPAKKVRKKARGRVPNHYGKLGLSSEQKETIYDVQAKYRAQIEALEQEVADLEQQQSIEITEVLTDDQRQSLKKILEDAASRKKKSAE